jgi:hypothetical protein
MRAWDYERIARLLMTATAALAALASGGATAAAAQDQDQEPEVVVPDLEGTWDGTPRARPINGPNQPWTQNNFPVLNERGLAYQQVFDEAIAPKYDCVASTSPALQYDPYFMQLVQWPDRVVIRYEKDDQTRTIWLDGREPPLNEYTLQGFSVGRYEADSLIVETTQFLFDITGFDDYNGIPTSQLKKVTEVYWRADQELRLRLTVEDPLFLREPASYTTRWLAAPEGYKLGPWECDAFDARRAIRFMVPRYR